ncbi:hypothetical protein DPMN_106849 [Dreissena polymorpha]|uniref:Uncharacterized protein n=1 Tax=Dreissena polymorpha TaxID=45954 RepID=A0A9D4QKF5_DREPO|nr:hypothetical protein DPMN_106849 [Dreissena polymorpha]
MLGSILLLYGKFRQVRKYGPSALQEPISNSNQISKIILAAPMNWLCLSPGLNSLRGEGRYAKWATSYPAQAWFLERSLRNLRTTSTKQESRFAAFYIQRDTSVRYSAGIFTLASPWGIRSFQA